MIFRRTALLASLALLVPTASGAEGRKVTPPQLLEFVAADFPPSEIAAGKSSAVLLSISISDTGEVVDVQVAQSGGLAFDEAAVAAARKFRFAPAAADGKPIPVKIQYRYDFLWKEELVRKSTSDFVGVVMDRYAKKPMAGVTVTLGDGTQAVTGEDGRFAFKDLPAGSVSVTLSGPNINTVGTEEILESGHQLDATYELEPRAEGEEEEFEIVITAPRVKKQVVSTEVMADQATKVPGTSGDVLKVVENLPGVARSGAGSGSLVVWGAAPQDTRVYMDGIRIPRLYHEGGYRSVFSSDMVRSVELIPGGYGPMYGRGLGGIVAVQSRALDEDGTHGSVAADGIDGAASVRTALSDKLHIFVAGRRSWLDQVLAQVTSEDVGDIVPIPRYWDAQARLVYKAGPTETVEAGGLLSSDAINRTFKSDDPSLTTSEERGLDFARVYLKYENKMEDGTVVSVVPFFGTDSTSLVSRFGAVPVDVTSDTTLFGLRSFWRSPLSPEVTAELGVDLDFVRSRLRRSGSLGSPAREGDARAFRQPPPDQIAADDWNTTVGSVAPYGQVDIGLLEGKLHLIPGLRVEPVVTTTSRAFPQVGETPSLSISRQDAFLEPRVSARYQITDSFSVKAAYGQYHQPPEAEDLSAVFGTPSLGPAAATHYLLGGAYKITELLDVEVTGFLSKSEDLVSRSTAESPALAQVLAQKSVGRSFGAQVLLRQQQLGPFFGWLSYSLLKSERKDAPGLPWRPFDFDQTHVFTALGSFDLGKGYQAGARFRYATGFPRTPVTSAYFDSTTGLYQPIFGERNSERLPSFISVDLRFSRDMKVGPGDLEIYLDVQNVTNHENAEEIVYNPAFTEKDYITGFPVLPILGARYSL